MAQSKQRSLSQATPDMIPGACRAVPSEKLMTAEELFLLSDRGMQYELLDGALIEMSPPGWEHGYVMGNVYWALRSFVQGRDLGIVLAGDPGVILRRGPDTVLGPDVCFVAKGRLPEGRLPKAFFDLIPDLIVEIVSPGDTRAEVEQKIQEWLQAGARLVWAVYPDTRSVAVRSSSGPARVYGESETLDGGDVLPGFAVRVSEFFA